MKRMEIPERGAQILFDRYDNHLKFLESLFDATITARGTSLFIEGEEKDVEALEQLLSDFSTLVERGQSFSDEDLKPAFKQIAENAALRLHDLFPKMTLTGSGHRQISPKGANQKKYLEAMQQNDIVFAVGPAGTGKTYLAVAMAVHYLLAKKVDRIILCRPAVEAGERLGFLPGDLQEKVNPYLRPLYDALYHLLDGDRVGRLMERGTIEIAPLAFMRGRTLGDSFIILDEAQNTTHEQMKMLLTRIGFNSKAVITGDVTQIDLPAGTHSGLVEAVRILGTVPGLSFCHFTDQDVVRHSLVQLIIKAYEQHTNGHRKK